MAPPRTGDIIRLKALDGHVTDDLTDEVNNQRQTLLGERLVVLDKEKRVTDTALDGLVLHAAHAPALTEVTDNEHLQTLRDEHDDTIPLVHTKDSISIETRFSGTDLSGPYL